VKAELICGKSAYKTFSKVGADVYKGNKYYRGTEASIENLILDSNTVFNSHATSKMFVVRDGNDLVARFALIHDHNLKDYVQVSFFEAHKNLGNLFELIKKEIYVHFPQCSSAIVGLNGHLNYSAGILLNRFDEPPLFGLTYTPDYYPEYFKNLTCRKLMTYRFSMDNFYNWHHSYQSQRTMDGLTIRFMDKRKIEEESALYTMLNNKAFTRHPYWSDRDSKEDLELFYPFRFLLDNENLIFAEINGKAIGFYLWYPDFNQLISTQRDLNVWDVIKFRLGNSIDTFRFTEIGIVPEYQGSPVALAMINKCLPVLNEKGYRYCEGGFIFEDNQASVNFVKGILKRCLGHEPKPYRLFAVFETKLK
jgi:hypothetical protein